MRMSIGAGFSSAQQSPAPRKRRVRMILRYRVVTAVGDQFLCEREPIYGEHRVELVGFHVTDAGWHGECHHPMTCDEAQCSHLPACDSEDD
jgi:hypothetical protein